MIHITFRNNFEVPGHEITEKITAVFPNALKRWDEFKAKGSETFGPDAIYAELTDLYMSGIKRGLEMAGVPNVSWKEVPNPEPKEENDNGTSGR